MSQPLQPDPKVYPACSRCGEPYILRLGFAIFTGGERQWAWFRDCRHRSAPPVTVDNRPKKPKRAPRPCPALVTR